MITVASALCNSSGLFIKNISMEIERFAVKIGKFYVKKYIGPNEMLISTNSMSADTFGMRHQAQSIAKECEGSIVKVSMKFENIEE